MEPQRHEASRIARTPMYGAQAPPRSNARASSAGRRRTDAHWACASKHAPLLACPLLIALRNRPCYLRRMASPIALAPYSLRSGAARARSRRAH